VSFRLGTHAPAAVVEALGKRGIWLRTLAEPDCVRACTHLTTTAEEVEQLLANLADLIRSAG
jgi:L-cysteine/cystine lyase